MNFKLVLKLILFLSVGFAIGAKAQRKKDKEVKSTQYIQQEAEYYFTEGEKQFILEDYAKAVTNFRSSIQLAPTNDVAYFKLAQIYNITEQLDAAELSIVKAIDLNDENPYYYLLAADIYTNASNLKEATKYYEKLINKIPGEEHVFFQLGAIYLYLQEYENALETYQKAEVYFGVNEQASVQKQKIYLKQNKIDSAIKEGQKLIDTYPGDPKYIIMLAELLSANGREHQAIVLIKGLTNNANEVPGAGLLLADLYRKTKDLNNFESELIKAFNSDKVTINAKINAVMKYMALLPDVRLETLLPKLCDIITTVHPDDNNGYLLKGDVYSTFLEKQLVDVHEIEEYKSQAIAGYARFVRFDESKFNVWQNLLNLELQLNMFDSVIVHGQAALAVYPNQTWLYLVNGVAFSSTEQWQEAIFHFEEGIKRSANNKQMLELFYGYLGDSYHNIGNNEKSDNAYDRVLAINPNNELVLNNYSYYLSLRGQKLDKANEMSLILMRLNSDNLAYLDTYAWVQFKMGNFKEAKRVLEKVIANQAANGENFNHYGDVLFKLGNIEEAKKQWLKAQELDATIENINEKIEQGKIIQ